MQISVHNRAFTIQPVKFLACIFNSHLHILLVKYRTTKSPDDDLESHVNCGLTQSKATVEMF